MTSLILVLEVPQQIRRQLAVLLGPRFTRFKQDTVVELRNVNLRLLLNLLSYRGSYVLLTACFTDLDTAILLNCTAAAAAPLVPASSHLLVPFSRVLPQVDDWVQSSACFID